MVEIVKVEPTDKCFFITWLITNKCNYDCMYCPEKWHSKNGKILTFDEMRKHWESIHTKINQKGLKYKIAFTGGEVTVNKDFLPFLEWLNLTYRDKIFQIMVTTNGSASLNYYEKLIKNVSNISFSVHSEHLDEKKFFDKVAQLRKKYNNDKFIHVNIMNEFWNVDRIDNYKKMLEAIGVSYSINEIDYSLKTRTQPIMKGKLNLAI
jgi:MoaA/NifB/PqqE/SkfB family radical SAM enzyme